MKGDIEELRTIIRLLTFLTIFFLASLIFRAEYEPPSWVGMRRAHAGAR